MERQKNGTSSRWQIKRGNGECKRSRDLTNVYSKLCLPSSDNLTTFQTSNVDSDAFVLIRVSRCPREAAVLRVCGRLRHSWQTCKQFEQRTAPGFYGAGRSCRWGQYVCVTALAKLHKSGSHCSRAPGSFCLKNCSTTTAASVRLRNTQLQLRVGNKVSS